MSLKKSSLKALNDLIIASFLTNYHLEKFNGGKSLEVPIHSNKVFFLTDYIGQHEIQQFAEVRAEENLLIIKPSIMLEQKLKDWTHNGEVVALNPADLEVSTLLFWICLFVHKTDYSIGVKTTLSPPLQETFMYLFTSKIKDCPIASSGKLFHFQSFLELYLLSVRHNRPFVETGELSFMLSEKEKRRLRKIVTDEVNGEVMY